MNEDMAQMQTSWPLVTVGRGSRVYAGERNGRLTVIGRLGRQGYNWTYRVRCDCGVEKDVLSAYFRHHIQCWACAHIEGANKRRTHGASVRGKTEKLYLAWKGMRTRCENPKAHSYKWYGAKGVAVCDDWCDFETFRTWAHANGYKEGLSLDRLDTAMGYSPSNCVYVTKSENSKRARAAYRFVKTDELPGNMPRVNGADAAANLIRYGVML